MAKLDKIILVRSGHQTEEEILKEWRSRLSESHVRLELRRAKIAASSSKSSSDVEKNLKQRIGNTLQLIKRVDSKLKALNDHGASGVKVKEIDFSSVVARSRFNNFITQPHFRDVIELATHFFPHGASASVGIANGAWSFEKIERAALRETRKEEGSKTPRVHDLNVFSGSNDPKILVPAYRNAFGYLERVYDALKKRESSFGGEKKETLKDLCIAFDHQLTLLRNYLLHHGHH
jgi:hypothetical protein